MTALSLVDRDDAGSARRAITDAEAAAMFRAALSLFGSCDRPSRFSDGSYGVLHAGDRFEVALLETIHHHGRFMARTVEAAGWTAHFRGGSGARRDPAARRQQRPRLPERAMSGRGMRRVV